MGTSSILQNSMFTFATDVWAAGVVLFILLYGKLPFWSDDMVILFQKITAMNATPLPSALEYPVDDDQATKSSSALQLVEAMLLGDPTKRPTFLECVQYQWVQEYSDPEIERELVEASNQVVSHEIPSHEPVVTRGVKMEKKKSLSQMFFGSSTKDLSSPHGTSLTHTSSSSSLCSF
jgi:serine/threonine protein kinase